MGLTLAERKAVTETIAVRYILAGKREKSRILDELCATTGWHRNHARKALKTALQPKIVTARSPRPVKYGDDVIAALVLCRSEEHTSELQSLMRISYAVFCLKKKTKYKKAI